MIQSMKSMEKLEKIDLNFSRFIFKRKTEYSKLVRCRKITNKGLGILRHAFPKAKQVKEIYLNFSW